MWRLTVERNYKRISQLSGEGIECTDYVYFEAEDLEDIQGIIDLFNTNAVNGYYKFILVHEEEEGEEDA